MRTPGLAVAAQQRVFVGLEKQHRGLQRAPQGLQQLRQLVEPRTFADIDHQGGALDFGRVAHQVGEVRNQADRQVVDRVVAEVFEGLQGRELSPRRSCR